MIPGVENYWFEVSSTEDLAPPHQPDPGFEPLHPVHNNADAMIDSANIFFIVVICIMMFAICLLNPTPE